MRGGRGAGHFGARKKRVGRGEEEEGKEEKGRGMDLLTTKYTYTLYDEILDEAPHLAPLIYTAIYRLGSWADMERCIIRVGPYQAQWEGREWNVQTTDGTVEVVKAPKKIEFEKRRKQLEEETEWGIPDITDTTYGEERPRHEVENPVRTERDISITEFKELKRPVKITGE